MSAGGLAPEWLEEATGRPSVAAPDCAMKYLPRQVDFGRMTSLVEGA